jgi:hypothetical protein
VKPINLVFFSNPNDIGEVNKVLDLKSKEWNFIEIRDFIEQKSIYKKFVENELTSIPIFEKIYDMFSGIKKKLVGEDRAYKKTTDLSFITHKYDNIEFHTIFEYITAEFSDKSDTLSREIFDKLKEISVFKDNFNFNQLNLFEINRYELINPLYYLLLNLFSILRLIEQTRPEKIYLGSSINFINKHLIITLAKRNRIEYDVLSQRSKKKFQNIKRYISSFRNLIERLWYWNIWNLFNRKLKRIKIPKTDKKITFTLCQYKNFFPSLTQVLERIDKLEEFLNILFIPHKLISYSRSLIKSGAFKNVLLYPIYDINYKTFRTQYNKLKEVFNKVKISQSLNDITVESIPFSNFIKLTLFSLFETYTYLLRFFETLNSTIKIINPDIIMEFSGNDPIDMLATRLAKNYDIPTIFIPHAIMGPRRDFIALEQDYIVCAGERDKDYYVSLGTNPDKIHVLGMPSFDKSYNILKAYQNPKDIRDKIVIKYQIDSKLKIVLLVTGYHEDFKRRKIFTSVANAIDSLEGCKLIVKIHPMEDILFYKEILKKLDIKNILIVDDPILHDLIVASDLVIGSSSNAQIESLLLEKDVIDLNYDRTFGIYLMEKYNASLAVFDPKKLKETIDKAFFDKETTILLKKGREIYNPYNLYKFDGKASLRVLDLIREILK